MRRSASSGPEQPHFRSPEQRPSLSSKKSVLGPWQFEIVAQRLAFVFATENSAPLQFRHHAVDEIVKPSWKIWKLYREAVGALGHEPFLHFFGNGCGSADHCKSGVAAEPLRELPHGEVFALREIDRSLLAAFGGITLWNVRQRPIRIEFRRVMAERDRQGANGV